MIGTLASGAALVIDAGSQFSQAPRQSVVPDWRAYFRSYSRARGKCCRDLFRLSLFLSDPLKPLEIVEVVAFAESEQRRNSQFLATVRMAL